MKHFKIKKGHNLRLEGAPKKVLKTTGIPTKLKVEPPNFYGIKPKLLVKEGDAVKIGSPLFFDKLHHTVRFTAPGSGTISKIKYGERRRVMEITIDLSDKDEFIEYETFKESDVANLAVDKIKEQLLESGLWPVIRQRPFSKIADPETTPKSIFVSAMPTAPFAPDMDFILNENSDGFQTGLNILTKLTSGKINLIMKKESQSSVLKNAQNVEKYSFSGPHPAGNVGIHIHHIDPLNVGETVWYLSVQDILAIGSLFLTGKLPIEKIISVAGSGLAEQNYLKIRRGMLLTDVFKNNQIDNDVRCISGDVLTGSKVTVDNSVGFYDDVLSVIPEGRERMFMGWAAPGFERYSISKTFMSKFSQDNKRHKLDTLHNGGVRAIIPFGILESVLPMDIMPTFLIKSILARDIEEMENLGIYECDPEDFALCSFADVSKMEITEIIRDGLEFVEADG